MGEGVIAHLDTDPAAAHFVGDGGGGAAAEEGVKNDVPCICCDLNDSLQKSLRFWRSEGIFPIENPSLKLGLMGMSNIFVKPNG